MNDLKWFGGLRLLTEAVQTVLVRTLDPFEVHGLPDQLRDLGLSVAPVCRSPAEDDEGGLQ